MQSLEQRLAPATFLVDDLSDDLADVENPKPGTLRYAVNRANDTPNSGIPDEITIIKMGMIPMSAPLEVSESVVIDPFGASEIMIDFSKMTVPGPGFTICEGQATDGSPITFTGLTITGTKFGPAILSMNRELVINACEITGNTNSGPGPGGGGIYFSSDTLRELTIQNSTIAGNSAFSDGGGVYLKGQVSANIVNSTISSNTAGGRGGGIAAPLWTGMNQFILRNSTVTANKANGPSGGGLFFNTGGPIPNVVSSIVSGNINLAAPDISAGPVFLEYSAIFSTAGFMVAPGSTANLFGQNVSLGPLGYNGGETRTHALGVDSAAINQGSNSLMLNFDQRGNGFARSIGGKTDIGAYELSNVPYAQSKRMDVKSAGGATFDVVVTYTDELAIVVASIDVNDIKVTGPNGYNSFAKSVVVDNLTNGSPRTATYTFDAPGMIWDAGDIGTYSAAMQLNQVFDNDAPIPHAVPAVPLGDFFVKIPVPIVVNELGDAVISNGTTTIREAIAAANGISAGNAVSITFDPIVFGAPTSISLLPANGGELTISRPVTIVGPENARVTLTGLLANRLFNINLTAPGEVFISNLTMTGGNSPTNGGAAIVTAGGVTFNNCTISNCAAGQNGGGIATAINGDVRLIYSTVSGNIAGTGGGAGIYVNGNGTLLIENSTISGNTCLNGDGGALQIFSSMNTTSAIVASTISGNTGRRGGGIFLNDWLGRMKIFNSTIVNNKANTIPDGGGVLVDGVGAAVGVLTLSSTILAKNLGANGPDLQFLSPLAPQNVGGDNNLVGVANVGNFVLTGMGNLVGALTLPLDPLLGPLANNGGPTQTHAPQSGSPALKAGNNVLCLQFDQRGLKLDDGEPMSIGSFGTNIVAPPTVANVTVNGGSVQRSNVFSINVTFSEAVSFTGSVVSAFTLTRKNAVGEQPGVNGLVNISAAPVTGPVSSVLLTFLTSGPNLVFAVNNLGGGSFTGFSLPDGTYDLSIDAAKVSGFGGALDGDGNGSGGDSFFRLGSTNPIADPSGLFRLYGDVTGDGNVGNSDFLMLRSMFASGLSPAFDYNNDGDVSNSDFNQFRARFSSSLP